MPHGEHDLEEAFDGVFSDAEGNLLIPAGMRAPLVAGLVKAVEFATTNALALLLERFPRRAVRATAIATAVVVAGISVPVTYVLSNESQERDCHLITRIATVQKQRLIENKGATQRFKHESADRLGLAPARFDELIREGEEREARQLAVYNEVASATC